MMRRCAWVVVVSALLCGCAARPQTWRDASGAVLGTITTVERPGGNRERSFVDQADRLRRREFVNARDVCATTVCAEVFDYDDRGHLHERHYEDERGAQVVGDGGYAVARYAWLEAGFECTFFAVDGVPTERVDGAHSVRARADGSAHAAWRIEFRDRDGELVRVRNTVYQGEQLREIHFVGPAGEPAEGRFRGATVARVRYDYVKGANDVDVAVEHYLRANDTTLQSLYYVGSAPADDPCH